MFKTLGNTTLTAACCVLFAGACVKTVDGELELTDDSEATASDGEAADTPSDVTDAPVTDVEGTAEPEPADETETELPVEEDGEAPAAESEGETEAEDSDPSVPTDDVADELDAGAPAEEPVEPALALDWDAGWIDTQECVFTSDPVPYSLPPDAPADAGPPPSPQIILGDSPFLGPYLSDGAGYALYIYTADLPGDCNNPPVSTCVDDCLLSWPVFEAGDRELGEELEDTAFGTFVRDDGVQQTTYYGWPLYYYMRDEEPGTTGGQGKGKVWYLAEQELPNLVIMRGPEELEGIRYLADGRGRTLYAHEGDEMGGDDTAPRPMCAAECRRHFSPFSVRSLHAVTELEPGELSTIVQGQGANQQVSFRGQPLYLAKDDERSGDMSGLLQEGFYLVEP